MVRRILSVARTEAILLVRSPLTLLLLAVITALGVIAAGPANVRDFGEASQWWLAGQGAWVTGELLALAVVFLMSRSLHGDRAEGRLDLLASSTLRPGEYLTGKLLTLAIVSILPGAIVAASTPIARLLAGASADPAPYLAAFLSVYLPTVVFAVVVASGLGLVTDRPRLVTIGYSVLWLVSAFPFPIPRVVQTANVVGTMTYATYFEFGDSIALQPVPVSVRAALLADIAADRPVVALNLILLGAALLLVMALTSRWLRRAWHGPNS